MADSSRPSRAITRSHSSGRLINSGATQSASGVRNQPPEPTRLERMEASISSLSTQFSALMDHLSTPVTTDTTPAPHQNPSRDALDPTPSPKIVVRNQRLAEVLSVERYRLRNRLPTMTERESSSLTTTSNQLRPRMEGAYFGGDPPLSVIKYLSQLSRVSIQSQLSEAVVFWIMEDFLLAPAKETFRHQGLRSYPEAVHWLLSSYASESSLEVALRNLTLSQQSPTETVRSFSLRLQLVVGQVGDLISPAELKTIFTNGLKDQVRSFFLANQSPVELEQSTPFSVLVTRAEQLEVGMNALIQQGHVVDRSRISRENVPRSRSPVPQYRVALTGVETELDYELGCLMTNDSSGKTCFFCYKPGHFWGECPYLSSISREDKSEITARRVQYFENRRRTEDRTYNRGRARLHDQRNVPNRQPTLLRPGWRVSDGSTVTPSPLWPDTDNNNLSSPSENLDATPPNHVQQ